ncbi:MAG TPA: hypothetical protein VF074_23695, partial [Pyrinomonadaceae bacterium]
LLRDDREVRQNDDCQKSDPRNSCHDGFLFVTSKLAGLPLLERMPERNSNNCSRASPPARGEKSPSIG